MKPITTKVPLSPPKGNSASGGPGTGRKRTGSQPVITPQNREISTEAPALSRSTSNRLSLLPEPVITFSKNLDPRRMLDKKTRAMIVDEGMTKIDALIAKHKLVTGKGAELTLNVLWDIRWFLTNVERYLDCFQPHSATVSFQDALVPAHRQSLMEGIAGIFSKLKEEDQAHLIAVCEPDTVRMLLSEAKVRISPRVAELARTFAEEEAKAPQLSTMETLALFDYHHGHTQTFMVSNCAARLATNTQDGSYQEFTRFHDELRASAYEKLLQNEHFTGTETSYRGVKLEREGGAYIVGFLEQSHRFQSKLQIPHQQSATTDAIASYANNDEESYSHEFEFQGVKHAKVHLFNNVDAGESEVVILPGTPFTVVDTKTRAIPLGRGAYKDVETYVFKAATPIAPRSEPKKKEDI